MNSTFWQDCFLRRVGDCPLPTFSTLSLSFVICKLEGFCKFAKFLRPSHQSLKNIITLDLMKTNLNWTGRIYLKKKNYVKFWFFTSLGKHSCRRRNSGRSNKRRNKRHWKDCYPTNGWNFKRFERGQCAFNLVQAPSNSEKEKYFAQEI